jgi:ABC-type transporter Mla subunit MlaD
VGTRTLAILALCLVAGLAAAFTLLGGSSPARKITLLMPEASGVVSGQAVREGGAIVGRVARVDIASRGAAARVDLALDDAALSLRQGTTVQLRWGGTVNLRNRYFLIEPGPRSAPALPGNTTLPVSVVRAPQEFDHFLEAFPGRTRSDLRDMLDRLGTSAQQSRTFAEQTLARAPAALENTAGVLGQLGADLDALETMVRSGDNVLAAVERSRPRVRALLQGSADTFTAVAGQSRAVDVILRDAPASLRSTQALLAQARPALDDVRDVTARLRPGVGAAQRLAAPLTRLVDTLHAVAPDATNTVRDLSAAAPGLTDLLSRAAGVAPDLGRVARRGARAVHCIRPFTPEIAGFFSTWSDFTAASDGKDKLFRAQVQSYLPAAHNANAITPAEAKQRYPQLTYGFPRPPGTSADQPWFIPECNVTQDALNPAKDPEAK